MVIGYSHGGSVALEALTLSEKQLPPPGDKTFSREEHSLDGIRAVVVYYPNCRPGMYFHWHSQIRDIPLQFHMALNDEYVRPDLCDAVISRIRQHPRFSKLSTLYYDARHAFDMKEYGDAYNEHSKQTSITHTLEFIRETLDKKYKH